MVDNPQAFPGKGLIQVSDDPLAIPVEVHHLGMTLRDYFAGKAIAGAINGRLPIEPDVIANNAYRIADAMLVARK